MKAEAAENSIRQHSRVAALRVPLEVAQFEYLQTGDEATA